MAIVKVDVSAHEALVLYNLLSAAVREAEASTPEDEWAILQTPGPIPTSLHCGRDAPGLLASLQDAFERGREPRLFPVSIYDAIKRAEGVSGVTKEA